MTDVAIKNTAVVNAPSDYKIPGAQEILLKSVRATFNGTTSSAAYLPCLQLLSPDGTVEWTAFPSTSVAAGGSADVSWFPGGNVVPAGSGAGGTGGGNLPLSGVTAGTYGDASHVGVFTVDAEGIITSATNAAVSSGGGFTKIFDQTLGAPAGSIDTGAGGIPAGYSGLMCYCLARRSDAVASASLDMVINSDTGNNYDQLVTDNSNGVMTPSWATNQPAAKVCEIPGANIAANRFAYAVVWIPFYSGTTAYKGCVSSGGFVATAVDAELVEAASTWRNTAAITRLTFQPSGGVNLLAGSRVTIYGLV